MSDVDQLTRPARPGAVVGQLNGSLPLAVRPDELVRAIGIVGLIGVAVIHIGQVVPTFDQTPWLGFAFVLLTVACVILAAGLLHRGTVSAWVGVALVNLLAIGGFVFTRSFSSAFDNQDVGNWSEMLGVVALFTEGLLVLLSLYAIEGQWRPRRRPDSP